VGAGFGAIKLSGLEGFVFVYFPMISFAGCSFAHHLIFSAGNAGINGTSRLNSLLLWGCLLATANDAKTMGSSLSLVIGGFLRNLSQSG
jgi:hypothetical protein